MSYYSTMIGGKSLYDYDAELVEYTVGPVSYENGYFLPAGSIMPVLLHPDIGTRPISLTVDVNGRTMSEISKKISALTSDLINHAELYLPDEFYYSCSFESATTPEEKAPWIMQVTFSLRGYRHGAMRTVQLSQGEGTKKLIIEGNYKAPVRFIIKPKSSHSVQIGDISISNMNGTVILDGIKKKVTEDGKNKFADTDLIEFPSLDCGRVSLDIIGDAEIVLEYYPVFL